MTKLCGERLCGEKVVCDKAVRDKVVCDEVVFERDGLTCSVDVTKCNHACDTQSEFRCCQATPATLATQSAIIIQ